jgi:hypothetical protein
MSSDDEEDPILTLDPALVEKEEEAHAMASRKKQRVTG